MTRRPPELQVREIRLSSENRRRPFFFCHQSGRLVALALRTPRKVADDDASLELLELSALRTGCKTSAPPTKRRSVAPSSSPPTGARCRSSSAKLRVEAGGGLARVVLEQTFENPYDDTLRVTYKMPLPVDGAVSGYAFRIGTRTITGQGRSQGERARALRGRRSSRARPPRSSSRRRPTSSRRRSATSRRARRSLPRSRIDQRLAWKSEGEWELRFPTVIGPRYSARTSRRRTDARRTSSSRTAGGVRGRVHLEVPHRRRAHRGRPRRVAVACALVAVSTESSSSLDARRCTPRSRRRRALAGREARGRPRGASRASRGRRRQRAQRVRAALDRAARARRRLRSRAARSHRAPRHERLDGRRSARARQARRRGARSTRSPSSRSPRGRSSSRCARTATRKSPLPGTTSREGEGHPLGDDTRRPSGGTEMHSAIVDALHGLRAGRAAPGRARHRRLRRRRAADRDDAARESPRIVQNARSRRRLRVPIATLAASLARAGRGAEVLVGLDEDAERSAKTPRRQDARAGAHRRDDRRQTRSCECAPEHVPDVFAGAPVLAALQVRPRAARSSCAESLARGTGSSASRSRRPTRARATRRS